MTTHILRKFIMETKSKKPYESPTTEVYSVEPEGIICQSRGIQSMRSSYGEAQEDEWY